MSKVRKMYWMLGTGVLVAVGLGLSNYNWYKSTIIPPLRHFADAKLIALDGSSKSLLGGDIWKDTGAVIMIEASLLSSLKPELDNLGVQLVGIVHETKGTEEFYKFLNGPLYLDKEKTFYGPVQRRMGISGLFRFGVWRNILRARGKGISGNFEGEGRILGGVMVVSKEKGIVFYHAEKEFGDHADIGAVLKAARDIKVLKK